MGKKAQRRREKSLRKQGSAEGAGSGLAESGGRSTYTTSPTRPRVPIWAVPSATIVFATIAWFAFDSAAAAGSIALLGLLGTIGLFSANLGGEIPPVDRNRAASIDFGRKQ